MEPVTEDEKTNWNYFPRHASPADDMSGFSWARTDEDKGTELKRDKVDKAVASITGGGSG
jgi:hypothetical protein